MSWEFLYSENWYCRGRQMWMTIFREIISLWSFGKVKSKARLWIVSWRHMQKFSFLKETLSVGLSWILTNMQYYFSFVKFNFSYFFHLFIFFPQSGAQIIAQLKAIVLNLIWHLFPAGSRSSTSSAPSFLWTSDFSCH